MKKIVIDRKIATPEAQTHHIHSAQSKKAALNRMSKCLGHLESVKRMTELDADSKQILLQLSAIRSEIDGISRVITKDHLTQCLMRAIRKKDPESIDELTESFSKGNH